MSQTSTSSSAIEKLQRLRESYTRRLPQRLDFVELLWKGLLSDWEWDKVRELRGAVHKLSGSGATFGYPQITLHARAIESELNTLIREQKPPTPESFQRVESGLYGLRRALSVDPSSRLPSPPGPTLAPAARNQDTRPRKLPVVGSGSFRRRTPSLERPGFNLERGGDELSTPLAFQNSPGPGQMVGVAKSPAGPSFPGGAEHTGKLRLGMEDNLQNRNGGFVLVVEDDTYMAQLVSANLEKSGIRCAQAYDGPEALKKAKELQPDLILLDVMLPTMNGFDVCREIREHEPLKDTPVIFVTAVGQESEIVKAYELGADDYVTKPFNHRVLMAKVKKAVARRRHQEKMLAEKLKPGLILDGRYEIVREVGRGGMSLVYLVVHKRLGSYMALKALSTNTEQKEQALERFQREIHALARLHHPHLVRIHDTGSYGRIHYYIMDYMPGGSLCDRLQHFGPIKPKDTMALVAKIADALDYAHKHDILHRDLKTENIMFTASGEPVVTDFGLVLNVRSKNPRLTREGFVIGTPYCMSPEQLSNPNNIDARSDIYSLGLMMYEMLTAQTPFTNFTDMEAMMKIMNEDIESPRRIDPSIPEAVEAVCLKALARRRENRFQSAIEVAKACRQVVNQLS